MDVIYGITANNNPTVQDVWNTTPAWSFPYAASTIAPTPVPARTIIDGAFAAHVGSVGAYAFINDMLYLEASAYRTLDFNARRTRSASIPSTHPGCSTDLRPIGAWPSSRIGATTRLMVGTFGMIVQRPALDRSHFVTGTTGTLPQTDKFTDVGFDSQYQYQGDNYWLTLRGSYIREFQKLDCELPHMAVRQSDQRAQRASPAGLVCLWRRQPDCLDRPVFQYLGHLRPNFVCGPCERRQPEQQRLDCRDRLYSVRNQHGAGLAVAERAHCSRLHVLQQVRRHHDRRQQQQHAVPSSLVGHVGRLACTRRVLP